MALLRTWLYGAPLALALGCSGAEPPSALPPAPTTTAPPAEAPPPDHVVLGSPSDTPLDITLIQARGGRGVFALAYEGDPSLTWLSRVDEPGPPTPVSGAVVSVLRGPKGAMTLVTSDGAKLCLSTLAPDKTPPPSPEMRCREISPLSLVPVGDKIALLEARVERPAVKGHRAKPAPQPPKKKRPAAPQKPKGSSKGSSKPGGKHGKPKGGGGGGGRPAKPIVELFLRWATEDGIDEESRSTGLRFEAPADGITVLDARARGAEIDVLWVETAPKRRSRSALGSGRLMAGTLRQTGSLDRKGAVAIADADADYSGLKDKRSPRLFGDDTTTIVLYREDKGALVAQRALPSLGKPFTPSPEVAALAPDRLAQEPNEAQLSALRAIAAEGPKRGSAQGKHDLGLVAWAGDRAYYQRGPSLFSAALDAPAPRAEPRALSAKRLSVAWGALDVGGAALAVTSDGVVKVDGDSLERAPLSREDALSRALLTPDIPADRRRAAWIGGALWSSRGGLVRAYPAPVIRSPSRTSPLHPDTSILVGGVERGSLVEVAGEAMSLATIDRGGVVTPRGAPFASPVRPGLDACERGGGGAIIAGVSALDPAKVVAFAADTTGVTGAVYEVPLPIHEGELLVRLTPLPTGGALLTDRDRHHVVWLDAEGKPLASAATPTVEEGGPRCAMGRALPPNVPSPEAGRLIAVPPEVRRRSCLVGEPQWRMDGSLAWIGGRAEGLDWVGEVHVLRGLVSPFPPLVSRAIGDPKQLPKAAAPTCPPEMVAVNRALCVDRFEATIVDAETFAPLEPDYPVTPNLLDAVLAEWSSGKDKVGSLHARAMPLPPLHPSRLGRAPKLLAWPRAGARPNGYVTGLSAEAACAGAGKRLCTVEEHTLACRGEADTQFPYGDTFEDGLCNVFREEHPAAILHDNASIGHLDPRLNRVRTKKGKPLFLEAGASRSCRSRFGRDAAYDLAGNLDEWVSDEGGHGAFAGGFYARSTRSGCEALITSHPKPYLDYSTGVRCCKDASP